MIEATLRKRLGRFALDVSFSVGRETFILFGPSGSGKTTVLHCLAGLLTPEEGRIAVDGEEIFRAEGGRPLCNVPARKRRIGYVFQDYALFPHMTVEQNVAYGARRRDGLAQRVEEMLRLMRLSGLERLRPRQLSSGQQQRVAIARALMTEPRVLLLDEPFSALDSMVREKLQQDLKRLQQRLGLTVLYVTHELSSALALGHRIGILNDGHLEQVGLKEDIFFRPRTRAVARFTGTKNLFWATVHSNSLGSLRLSWDGHLLEAPPQDLPVGERVSFCIRPENVLVLREEGRHAQDHADNRLLGRIVEARWTGATVSLFVKLRGEGERDYDLEVAVPSHVFEKLRLHLGKEVALSLKREAIHLIPSPSASS